MCDVFDDLLNQGALEPPDPSEAARRGMRPALRRRFYNKAEAAEGVGSFQILLDRKAVLTPARRVLAAPEPRLAQAIAAEWESQKDVVDAATMPLTRIANSIIDGVADAPQAVTDEIAKYLGSDLLLYRAGEPQGLVERQARHWDPVLAWARETLGARFVLAEGVIFVAQADEAIAAARSAIPHDPWRLGALSAITTLTGSALLALALAGGRLSVEQAWESAHVDEDWQMRQWGQDDVVLKRRACRFMDLQAAATVLAFLS
jgi:chaperone required for assembly of F1-ATPase